VKKVLALTVIMVIAVVIVVPTAVLYFLGGPEGPKTGGGYRGEDILIRVYLHEQDRVVEMNLEEYVKGVVAAEMPAEFDLEALKAQAVAAGLMPSSRWQCSAAPAWPTGRAPTSAPTPARVRPG
jgi:stage II sporulation protein D